MAGTISLGQRYRLVAPPVSARLDPSHPLAQGLAAYWPLNAGPSLLQDYWGAYPLTPGTGLSMGLGHHGHAATLFPGATPSKGSSSTLATRFAGKTAVTMAAWYYRASTAHTLSIGWTTNTSSRFFLLWNSDGKLYGVAENAPGYSGVTAALTDTGWHHVVMSYDGTRSASDRVRLYVDGTVRALTVVGGSAALAATLATAANLGSFDVGYDVGDNFWSTGRMSDVGIWGRALHANDVAALYAQPTALFAPPLWQRYFFIPPSGGTTTPVALSGTQAQSGSLIVTVSSRLSGTQPQSGSIARQVSHPLSGTQAQSGAITRSVTHALTGTQAQSGSVTHTVTHPLSGTQPQSGSLTLSETYRRALSGTQPQSGSILRTVTHPLSGTQAQVGTTRVGVAHFLSGTQPQLGTVTRQVPRLLSGTQAQLGGISTTTIVPIVGCLSTWGVARWGEYRWGEITDLIVITQGSATPTGAFAKTPTINRDGSATPTGDLAFPPEWMVTLPPSRPGGYPVSTKSRQMGQMTRQTQVPPTTEEV